MAKAKVKEYTLEDKIRMLIDYEHYIKVDSWCSFGDHWRCSCGETGLDSPSGHHASKIIELINIERGIEEAIEHGHPNWSHVIAHGPCTKPSFIDGVK